MIQEIITYTIVLSAFIMAGYKTSKVFLVKNKKLKSAQVASTASGCDSCSTDCALRDSLPVSPKTSQR
jgi:hypothetical protein